MELARMMKRGKLRLRNATIPAVSSFVVIFGSALLSLAILSFISARVLDNENGTSNSNLFPSALFPKPSPSKVRTVKRTPAQASLQTSISKTKQCSIFNLLFSKQSLISKQCLISIFGCFRNKLRFIILLDYQSSLLKLSRFKLLLDFQPLLSKQSHLKRLLGNQALLSKLSLIPK